MSLARTSLRMSGVAAAAVLVLSTASTASATNPPPPVANGSYQPSQSVNGTGVDCTGTATSTVPDEATLTANAAPVTTSYTTTGTVTNNQVSGDVSQVSVSNTAVLQAKSAAGYPSKITASFSGHGSVMTAAGHSPSGCSASGTSTLEMETIVTLSRPGLVTINAHSAGNGVVTAVLASSTGGADVEQGIGAIASLPGASGLGTGFLPAGSYEVLVEGGVALQASTTTKSVTGSGTVSVVFTPGGTRTSGVSGNGGGRYVALGGARTCPTHALPASVTSNRKLAAQIQSVKVYGNGHLLKSVTRPAARRSLTVKLPDAQNETVRVNVVLRNGKKLTETATYLRCS